MENMLLPLCAVAATGATILSYVSSDTILRSPIKWIFTPSVVSGSASCVIAANTSPETQRYMSLALCGGIAISYVGYMYRRGVRNMGMQAIKECYTSYKVSKLRLGTSEQHLSARELFNSIKDYVKNETGDTMSEKELDAAASKIYLELKEHEYSNSGSTTRNIEGSYISHLINERCIHESTDNVVSVAEKLDQSNVMFVVRDRLTLTDAQYDAILKIVSCINSDYVPIGADFRLWDNVLFHDSTSVLLDIRGPSYVENFDGPDIRKACVCVNIDLIMKQSSTTE